jgi:hypothetical protein
VKDGYDDIYDKNYGTVGETALVLAPKSPALTQLYKSDIIPYTTSTIIEIEQIVMSNSHNLFVDLWSVAQKVSTTFIYFLFPPVFV